MAEVNMLTRRLLDFSSHKFYADTATTVLVSSCITTLDYVTSMHQ